MKLTSEVHQIGSSKSAVLNKPNKFLPYKEAKEFVKGLQLSNQKEWFEYAKSDKKPNNIPSSPSNTYKDKGWIGIGDWLGTGSVAPKDKIFLPFKEAREFVKGLQINDQKEWFEYVKSDNKPDNIPSDPRIVYRDNGWMDMGDWLGTGRIADKYKIFLPFEEVREFVKGLELSNVKEWQEYCKSGKKPDNIPSRPDKIYKDKGYISWGDWLGTGRVATKDIIFLPFKGAREFVKGLQLSNQKQWVEYAKSGNKPDNIPYNPHKIYEDNGWVGIGDWLGTDTL